MSILCQNCVNVYSFNKKNLDDYLSPKFFLFQNRQFVIHIPCIFVFNKIISNKFKRWTYIWLFSIHYNSYKTKNLSVLSLISFTFYAGSYKTVLVTRTRIELMIPPWEGGVLTAWPTGHNNIFIPQVTLFSQYYNKNYFVLICNEHWANMLFAHISFFFEILVNTFGLLFFSIYEIKFIFKFLFEDFEDPV